MNQTAWVGVGGVATIVLSLVAFWRLLKNEIAKEVGALRREFTTLRENDFAHLEKKVADLDARMDRMGDRMSRMDERIKEVRTEVRDTRRELKADILATEGRLMEAIKGLSLSVG